MPWGELDKEEWHESRTVKTGSCPYLQDKSENWYGGKVHFTARLIRKGPGSPFSIILEQPYLSTSNTFSRRFTSKRFIRVKIPDDIFYKDDKGEMVEFFQRPFVLFKQVFRAFFAKDHTVFLFKTNEEPVASLRTDSVCTIRPQSPGGPTSPYDMSLLDFIRWHNPLELNRDQVSKTPNWICAPSQYTIYFVAYGQMGFTICSGIVEFCSGSKDWQGKRRLQGRYRCVPVFFLRHNKCH